jgi:CheY-like chemotaxis protein
LGASVLRKTILVADDNAQIRKAACAMLMQSENLADCIEAENGLVALQMAIERKPDLVILDYSMPVMDGFEAAKRIHEVLPGTPIVLFSLFAMFLQDHSVAK